MGIIIELNKSFPGIKGYLSKQAPPGGPPRPGLEWDSQKHRWVSSKHSRFDLGLGRHVERISELTPEQREKKLKREIERSKRRAGEKETKQPEHIREYQRMRREGEL